MNNAKLPFIIIMAGIFASEIVLLGGNEKMGVTEWVAISVALIGVASGIWVQVVQFKKDAQRIEGVNNTAVAIKQDTVKMEPLVTRIDITTDKLKDQLLGTVIPCIKNQDSKMTNLSGGIQVLVEKAKLEERMREHVSDKVMDPHYIKAGIDVIYRENVRLNQEVHNLTTENVNMKVEIAQLRSELNRYRMAEMNIDKVSVTSEVRDEEMEI